MPPTQSATRGEVRTVALDAIDVEDGFNPRTRLDRTALERLTGSIRQHGVLQPLTVADTGEGRYRLIAGHRRYLAASELGLADLPVLVRAVADDSAGLDLALVENIAREQLDPVEEATAFKRLLDAGLTRRGIAERLSLPQKRVTERLEILELPDELHVKVADGTIPPGAVKPLVRLARIHPGLPGVATRKVVSEPANDWDEPLSWADLARDPIAAVSTRRGEAGELPDGVYETGTPYPLERFTLDQNAERRLAELCKLIDTDPGQVEVRFGRDEAEQAAALGALHQSAHGYVSLIVGQEVADQLAGDWIARSVKGQRKHRRDQRRWERERAKANGAGTDAEPAPPEEEQAERKRAERQAQQEARRSAAAHNAELGAAVVKGFARVKLDGRVVKVLACLSLGSELDQVAMRGARYGFPGWPDNVEQKNGRQKTVYIDRRGDAGRKARDYLAVAKTPQEVAGRLIALVAMARYADEGAVAQSARSFYPLPVPRALPWSDQVVDLIDELAAERLPDHLTEAKRQERAEQREQEAERERLRASVEERLARSAELSAEQRAELVDDAERAYGPYAPEGWKVRERIKELDGGEAEPDSKQTGKVSP